MTFEVHDRLTVVQPGDLYKFADANGLLASQSTEPPVETIHNIPHSVVRSAKNSIVTLPAETLLTQSSFDLCVQDAIVCGDTLGVIFDQRYLLPGGFSHQHIWAVDKFGKSNINGSIARPDFPLVHFASKEAVLVGYTSHWGHFFTDAIDRLVPREDRQLPLLVDQGIPCANAVRLLVLSGYVQTPFQLERLASNRLYSIEKLWFRTLSSQKPAAPVDKLMLVKKSIENIVPKPKHRSGTLFVGRSNVKVRKLITERLEVDLKAIGISEIFYPELMPVDSSIEVFQSHSTIIFPIGSAKFNLIFCAPGTRVVCLTPRGYAESNGSVCMLIRHICAAFSLHLEFYSCEIFQQQGFQSNRLLHQDIQITKDDLHHILKLEY